MSIPSFRRIRRMTCHFETGEKRKMKKKAGGAKYRQYWPTTECKRMRREEKSGTKNDHFVTRDTKESQPLFVAPGDIYADFVNPTRQ